MLLQKKKLRTGVFTPVAAEHATTQDRGNSGQEQQGIQPNTKLDQLYTLLCQCRALGSCVVCTVGNTNTTSDGCQAAQSNGLYIKGSRGIMGCGQSYYTLIGVERNVGGDSGIDLLQLRDPLNFQSASRTVMVMW